MVDSPSMAAGPSVMPHVPPSSRPLAERDRKRISLRLANIDIWKNGPRPPTGPLDSNMKKNTGFIKRIRQSLGAESRDQILKEIDTLNLDKYVEEIILAAAEGLGKCTGAKDFIAAAECMSALHRRFSGSIFALPLSALLSSQLAVPSRAALQALPVEQRERDEQARVTRQKTMIRAVAELALVELPRMDKGKEKATASSVEASTNGSSYMGGEWLYTVLKDMLANDREHSNIIIVQCLLKVFGATLVGPPPEDSSKADERTEERANTTLEDEQLLSVEMQAKFRKLIETYYGTLAKRIVKEFNRLQEQNRRNHEAYIKSGEIFEDRQQNYERMSKEYEKLEIAGKKMSELIGIPMPELANENKSAGVGLAINMDSRANTSGYDKSEAEFASGKSPWEDEDTRRFYEDLIDLTELVPMSLLSQGQSKVKPDDKTVTLSPEMAPGKESIEVGAGDKSAVGSPDHTTAELPKDSTEKKDDAEESNTIGAGPAAQLNALLVRLPDLYNRAMIDTAAVDFAFLNTKVARKKLIKQLGSVPRNRTDLIPHYARLIATLNRYMPDIGQGIMAILDEEFRYLQRKRNVDLAETRSKNMRFIGELTKFQVAPLYATFHFFKICLDDFTGPNIDNIATLLETCGRYLLRSPETSERMSSTLEMLRRKRATQNLDSRQLVLLDNAYYQCNPPERETTLQKEYSGLQLYISHLIYDVLSKKTMESVVDKLRKLPWDDAQVLDTLHNVFLRAWRIRFSHLHLLAVLLHELQAYHPDFVVYIIDGICENIRAGMESNIFKDNQRRVATVKYLGELYNYRLVNSTIIFDQLWSFVTFGHLNGRPLPGQVSPIDAPDDYFRIRLVCTLLDACGHCFDRGSLRKRLDDYLLFLNIYTLSKTQPLPMDADFMLSDTLESLRPKFHFKKSFEEAAVAVDEMFALQIAKAEVNDGGKVGLEKEAVQLEDEDMDSQSEQSDEDMLGPRQHQSHSTSESEQDEDVIDGTEEVDDDRIDEEDDDELITRETEDDLKDREAEDEFERELAKMMAESNSAASTAAATRNQRGLFDVGMPFIKKNINGSAASVNTQQDSSLPIAAAKDDQHMRFSFLTKKGNKHQTHQVSVPIDSAIAVNSLANEKQQLAERQQLKQLVLGIETREQMEDRRSLEDAMAKRGFRLKLQQQQQQQQQQQTTTTDFVR